MLINLLYEFIHKPSFSYLDVNTKRRLRASPRQAGPQLARTGSSTVKHVNKLL